MYTIEQYTLNDKNYDANNAKWVEIRNAAMPQRPGRAAGERYFDETLPAGAMHERSLIMRGREIIGCGTLRTLFWNATPNMFVVGAYILPAAQRLGAGTAWARYAEARLPEVGAESVMAFLYEDDPGAIAFVEKHGFARAQRNPMSLLRLEGFDFGRFSQTPPSGTTIHTLHELIESDPDWLQKAIRVTMISGEDMPRTEPRREITAEIMLGLVNHPRANKNGHFYAVDDKTGEWVGVSTLYYDQDNPDRPGRISVGYTGVNPSHRRRGIATALKLRTIRFATEIGGGEMKTSNEESNPMYDINLKLGFRPMPAQLEYKKERLS